MKTTFSIVAALMIGGASAAQQMEKIDPLKYGFDPAASAEQNSLALQKMLEGGNRRIRVTKQGTYNLDRTVFIEGNTSLEFGPSVFVKKATKYANMIVNKAARDGGCDTNITIKGINIVTDGQDALPGMDKPWFGNRGNLAFFHVKDLTIKDFLCVDFRVCQYCMQIVDFDGLLVDGFDIRGEKDGIHLNAGKNFVIRNGILRTRDDGIAINAGEWSAGCTPQMGSIENGLIENVHDLQGGQNSFARVITGVWKDWHEGMRLQYRDLVRVGKEVYSIYPGELSTNETVSLTKPTHKKGVWKSPEGINFFHMQSDGETRADIRNVTIRNCRFESRPIVCRWEIHDWARLIHPEIDPKDYPVIDIRVENIEQTANAPVITAMCSCKIRYRNLKNPSGNPIYRIPHKKFRYDGSPYPVIYDIEEEK